MLRPSSLAVLGLAAWLSCCVTTRVQGDSGALPAWHPPAQSPIRLVLQTAAGTHFDLADHRGKALLVAAITTDNILSQALVRDLERLARAHDPADLAVVAIVGDTAPERELSAMIDSYAQVVGLTRVALAVASADVREGNSDLGPIDHVPTLFFFNRAGVLSRRIEGDPGYDALEALIAPAIPH